MGKTGTKFEAHSSLARFPSSSRNWTNAEIIEGIIGRSAVAGQALFEKYNPHISARVRRLMGPDAEWEDLVQQIFLALITAIADVREPKLLDRWVDRITVNAVRKEFRRRRRRWYLSYVPELPETIDLPERDGTLLFHRTASVLSTMHPDERIAFVLRFVVEEEIAPIAEMCGWSISTTKRRINKARDNFIKRAQRDPMLHSIMEGVSNE
ncbi:MAG: RNA polymerase sigma factor [Deltaproteobacteria bacterium]|nr:RNA polymerase sigma factor [Deltaproteobacteria bacterium]MBN2670319.1 RNA polymerase sigma factor [Deltaproteobacteria bacterium]